MGLPHASVKSMGIVLDAKEGDEEAEAMKGPVYETINKYLHHFADTSEVEATSFLAQKGAILCPHGHPLTGFLASNFRYGIAHGEGFCAFRADKETPRCDWPCRADHYIKDEDGDLLLSFTLPLPYHPDFVKENRHGNAL